MLKTKETVPTLKLDITLETYGMQIRGAVPKLALIDKAAPKDMINNEIMYIAYLLIFLSSMINNNLKNI